RLQWRRLVHLPWLWWVRPDGGLTGSLRRIWAISQDDGATPVVGHGLHFLHVPNGRVRVAKQVLPVDRCLDEVPTLTFCLLKHGLFHIQGLLTRRLDLCSNLLHVLARQLIMGVAVLYHHAGLE